MFAYFCSLNLTFVATYRVLRRNSHPVKLIAKKLAYPLPPVQCCYIALLGKAFKKTAISVRMPACIGQQHWSRGHGGSGVMWQHVGGWLFFFEELGIPIVSYPDAPCMVYLPTFGWCLGYMLIHIPEPRSIWVEAKLGYNNHNSYCIHTTAPDTETETVFEGV